MGKGKRLRRARQGLPASAPAPRLMLRGNEDWDGDDYWRVDLEKGRSGPASSPPATKQHTPAEAAWFANASSKWHLSSCDGEPPCACAVGSNEGEAGLPPCP